MLLFVPLSNCSSEGLDIIFYQKKERFKYFKFAEFSSDRK